MPNCKHGGPPHVSYPGLLITFSAATLHSWRHRYRSQPENVPCCCDKGPTSSGIELAIFTSVTVECNKCVEGLDLDNFSTQSFKCPGRNTNRATANTNSEQCFCASPFSSAAVRCKMLGSSWTIRDCQVTGCYASQCYANFSSSLPSKSFFFMHYSSTVVPSYTCMACLLTDTSSWKRLIYTIYDMGTTRHEPSQTIRVAPDLGRNVRLWSVFVAFFLLTLETIWSRCWKNYVYLTTCKLFTR
jgi:hypothetical protein